MFWFYRDLHSLRFFAPQKRVDPWGSNTPPATCDSCRAAFSILRQYSEDHRRSTVFSWLVVDLPLWKIWVSESQLGWWWFSIPNICKVIIHSMVPVTTNQLVMVETPCGSVTGTMLGTMDATGSICWAPLDRHHGCKDPLHPIHICYPPVNQYKIKIDPKLEVELTQFADISSNRKITFQSKISPIFCGKSVHPEIPWDLPPKTGFLVLGTVAGRSGKLIDQKTKTWSHIHPYTWSWDIWTCFIVIPDMLAIYIC